MASHDPGEGSSNPTPRYRLERGVRGRLALVSDIENVEGEEYYIGSRPVSTISTSDVDSTQIQFTPPGTAGGESARKTRSLSSLTRGHHRRYSSFSDAGLPNVDDEDLYEIGKVDNSSSDSQRHTGSAHTESSYGAIDAEGPPIVPTLAPRPRDISVPPPIPIKDQKRAMRPSSAHTASSYAMYTPRSPSKQVRFSEDLKLSIPPGENNIPPLPPHALAALLESRTKSKPVSPHYFHGPPPLHGDDLSPPDYNKAGSASKTDSEEGGALGWGEKAELFDPKDNDPEKPWWKRRKSPCFWILLSLASLVTLVAIIVGAVLGVKLSKDKNQEPWPGSNMPGDFPAPGGFLGTWAFPTRLTSVSSECAPRPEGAQGDLWRCFPFQEVPSSTLATWTFVISGEGADSNAENVQSLQIATAGNPFVLAFNPQPLVLTRYLTNAYYQFNYTFTKTTILNFNGRTARCEFPNTVLTGTFYVNNTIFSPSNPQFAASTRSTTDIRGEWPGDATITEQKEGGARQILCRDRETQDVFELGESLTSVSSTGSCLCGYQIA